MAALHPQEDDSFNEMQALVQALVTEQITPQQWSRLELLILHDAEARQLYLKLVYDNIALRWRAPSEDDPSGVRAKLLRDEPV